MDEKTQGLAWNDKYNIGKEEVDEQHKKLFEMINALASSAEDGSDTEKIRSTLDFLVEYTVQHFYDEEKVQVQYIYPDYEWHKKIHEDFKVTVTGLVAEFKESGYSKELHDALNKALAKWIVNHILQEDKKIGEHIRDKEKRW